MLKRRNHLALVARRRNGGPMKHRNAPRLGARNVHAELLEEHAEEVDDGRTPVIRSEAC